MTQLVLTVAGIQVGVLLLIRPIVWWYFGIGRAVRALEALRYEAELARKVRVRDARRAA